MFAQLDRPRVPVAGHQPAHRRLRRLPRQPGTDPARDRRRRARRDRPRHRPRRAPLRRRADRRGHHDRRGRRGGRRARSPPAHRLHQHVDRCGHRLVVRHRGLDARPARLRLVHPVGHPGQGPAAGGGRGPVQGPAPGRPGDRRRPLRPRGRGPGPDRRSRLRGQGAGRDDPGDTAVPLVQPGVRRAHGAQPLARVHREPDGRSRERAAGTGAPSALPACPRGGRRARRAPVGDLRRRARPPGQRARARHRSGRQRPVGGERAEPSRARRHRAQPAPRV